MEHIEAESLQDVWFNRQASRDTVEKLRKQSLQDVAIAMTQLNKYDFVKGGSPIFDKEALHITDIGPAIKTDNETMLERLKTDSQDENAIYYEVGPFHDPYSFLLTLLDRRKPPGHQHGEGLHKLLRLFIEWACSFYSSSEAGRSDDRPFVLSHPDFDIQNVLVSKEDGRLRGLIDWDGIAAVPRYLGNARYPSWLTRDWDPAKYSNPDETEDSDEMVKENSPDELAFYRTLYEEMMLQAEGGHNHSVEIQTKNSLVFENLAIVAEDPVSMAGIVSEIYDKAMEQEKVRTETKDKINYSLWEVGNALAEDSLGVERVAKIKAGFLALLYS